MDNGFRCCEAARKLVDQINLEKIVEQEAKKAIKVQYGNCPDIVKAVADVLVKQISLTLKSEK